MRAIAYNIRSNEKEPLALANMRKHHITLITNALTSSTADFAEGKEAVIVSSSDELSLEIVDRLVELGVRYILVKGCSSDSFWPELLSKTKAPLEVADLSFLFHQPDLKENSLAEEIALKTVLTLDRWQESKDSEAARHAPGYPNTQTQIRRSA